MFTFYKPIMLLLKEMLAHLAPSVIYLTTIQKYLTPRITPFSRGVILLLNK